MMNTLKVYKAYKSITQPIFNRKLFAFINKNPIIIEHKRVEEKKGTLHE